VRIGLPKDKIVAFCRRWRVKELAIFGSVLRDDFRPESVLCILHTLRSTWMYRPSRVEVSSRRTPGSSAEERSGFPRTRE